MMVLACRSIHIITSPSRSEYGQILAKEYLKFFEFENQPLDDSLRQFLACFSLTGESQERERVMVHFSERYHECTNQFDSADTVHGITVAVLLLNTDLHNDVRRVWLQNTNNSQAGGWFFS